MQERAPIPPDTALTRGALDDYLDQLGSAAPAPGGGSVAALTAAQGAALLSMVINLTLGKPKFSQHESDLRALLSETGQLRADCTALIDDDAVTLRALIAAYRLPRGNDEERAARTATLQERTHAATEIPLRVARAAVALPPLCRRLLPISNPQAVSDIGVAAACALAAFQSAELNVLINLGQLTDSAFISAVSAELAQLGDGLQAETSAILDEVRALL